MQAVKVDFFNSYDLLSQDGVIGFYKYFELIEVIAYRPNSKLPINIYSIAVAIDELPQTQTEGFINKDRIQIKSLENWSFGIQRSFVALNEFRVTLENFFDNFVWQPTTGAIDVGELIPLHKRFLPPDFRNKIALNKIAKNNFFSGCYLLELADVKKSRLQQIFRKPKALQELSGAINEIIPLEIGSVSDRLGNIVLQFPIELIRSRIGNDGNSYFVEIDWHPKSTARDVDAIIIVEHDNTITGFGSKNLSNGTAKICCDAGYGTHKGYIWDVENQLVLSGTDKGSFINTIALATSFIHPEPRIFQNLSVEGQDEDVRIRLNGSSLNSIIGDAQQNNIIEPTMKRIYSEEKKRLSQERKFVQYRPDRVPNEIERNRALDDLRQLINTYGIEAVWLWDPYLSPQDLKDTLFYNVNMNSNMLALTALKSFATNSTKESLVKEYQHDLSSLRSNYFGLNLEFRSSHGNHGWSFHDRFLIFPSLEKEARAWSLGTSVNCVGKQHHILQEVDNGQLIQDAFLELWEAIEGQENLIWKKT